MILLAIALVLVSEIFNTAIERLVDIVSPEHHPKAGIIKDIAAGAVLVASIVAVLIGVFIFCA
jgi:diacylglycerol kinase (ATP)